MEWPSGWGRVRPRHSVGRRQDIICLSWKRVLRSYSSISLHQSPLSMSPTHPPSSITSSAGLASCLHIVCFRVARNPLLASSARCNMLTTSVRPHHRPWPGNSLRPHRTLRFPLFPRCWSLSPPSPPTRIRFLNRHAPR